MARKKQVVTPAPQITIGSYVMWATWQANGGSPHSYYPNETRYTVQLNWGHVVSFDERNAIINRPGWFGNYLETVPVKDIQLDARQARFDIRQKLNNL